MKLKSIFSDHSFPALLVSLYLFIWFLQIGSRFGFLGTIRFEFLLGALLAGLSIAKLGKSPNLKSTATIKNSIWFMMFIFVIYTIFTYDQTRSWEIFSNRIFKFSLICLFFSVLITTTNDLRIALIGFALAMAKIIQEGYFGIATGGLIWENQGIPRLHGVTGLYRHPNSLSGLAVSALPFYLFFFQQFKNWIIKGAFAVGIIGLLLIVMYTGSRTGYVATAVIAFMLLWRAGIFRIKTMAIGVMIALAIVFYVPDSYKARFGTMFQSQEERGSSANKRMEILEDALSISVRYPLGVGVQAFPFVRQMEFNRYQDTHNLYLEVLTNLGPIGLIAFFVFIRAIFKTNNNSRQLLLKQNNTFCAELCYTVNLYIACRLVLGLFGMDLYEVYWWLAAGITISLAKIAAKGIPKESPTSAKKTPASGKIPA